MIDYRQIAFDHSNVEGITLVGDQLWGLALLGAERGDGMLIASLEPHLLFEAQFIRPDEQSNARFFVSNCMLRIDPSALLSQQKAPPVGSLLVSKGGVALMVRPPRGPPAPLCLIGDPRMDPFASLCITRWQIESPYSEVATSHVLFRHPID